MGGYWYTGPELITLGGDQLIEPKLASMSRNAYVMPEIVTRFSQKYRYVHFFIHIGIFTIYIAVFSTI